MQAPLRTASYFASVPRCQCAPLREARWTLNWVKVFITAMHMLPFATAILSSAEQARGVKAHLHVCILFAAQYFRFDRENIRVTGIKESAGRDTGVAFPLLMASCG